MTPQEALFHVTPATIEDIKPGALLWHVYGFSGSCRITSLKVVYGPITWAVLIAHMPNCAFEDGGWNWDNEQHEAEWMICEYDKPVFRNWRSLKDCGIGASYNTNRLFTSFEEATKYATLFNK